MGSTTTGAGAGKRNSTDGGWRTPGAGMHPPDGDGRTPDVGKNNIGLHWADKLLDELRSANGEGLDNSPEMEFWASLKDERNIVVDSKMSFLDKPEKRPRDAENDDDDDCIILDGDPEKATAKEEETRDGAKEDELQIVAEKGELACRDFPHPRYVCVSLPFSTSSHASHCSMCHCYVCDSPAPCIWWGNGTGINDHCHATDKSPKWKNLRQLFKSESSHIPTVDDVRRNLLKFTSIPPANFIIPSTVRVPIQRMHPSIMISYNTRQGLVQPRVPSPIPITTSQSSSSKRARVAPSVPPQLIAAEVSQGQGQQRQQGPPTDTSRTWRDALTALAYELGVPDYNVDPPVVQQHASSSSQTPYPNQLLAQSKACQGPSVNPVNAAGEAPLQIRFLSGHNWSNLPFGSAAISSDSVQARRPMRQLNPQSSHVPNEATSSTVVRSWPWNAGNAGGM